nr:response regulator receiver protein [uncultured Desulfuromonas sp.]
MLPVIIAYQSPAETDALMKCVEQAGCIAKPVATLNEAIDVLREEEAAIMLLGKTFEGSCALDVIPIFRYLHKHLKIILLADDATVGFLRQARAAGIFYHAMEPHDEEDCQELQLALECAREACEKQEKSLWKKLAPMFGGAG